MATFPGAVISYSDKTDGVDDVLAAHINSVQDEIEAIETELGADVAGQYTTLLARLNAVLEEADNAESTSASGNITLTDANKAIQFINCNGADRDCTLPAEAVGNHPFTIINNTAADYKITVKNDAGTAIAVVLDGKSTRVVSNGTAWETSGQKNVSAMFALTAGGGQPTTTSGCATAAKVELGTNDVDIYTLNFDPDSDKYAVWQFPLPDDYDGGTIKFRVYWSETGGSAFVVYWELSALAVGNDDAMDASWGSAVSVSDTGGTGNDLYITDWSAAVTIAGTPVAGDMCFFRGMRDADHASDSLDVDGRLHSIQILYTRR